MTHIKFSVVFDWNTRLICQVWNLFKIEYWRKSEVLRNHTKACISPKMCSKLPSVTHLVIPFSIAWISDKTHPKVKIIRQYECNPTKSKQLPWWHLHFISNDTLLINLKKKKNYGRICIRSHLRSKTWKAHYNNIWYTNFIAKLWQPEGPPSGAP